MKLKLSPIAALEGRLSSNNSNILMILIWVYFLFKTVYFALVIPLGVSPDESFHFNQILNHFHSPELFPDVNYFEGLYGRQYVNNFLYHWLLGQLLHFNVLGIPNLLFIRLINVILGMGFIFYSNRLFDLFFSSDKYFERIFFNLLITNTLMITFLYGMVSYDNLINLIAVFSVYKMLEFVQKRQLLSILNLIPFLVIGVLSKVTFYAFAFIVIIVCAVLLMTNWKWALKGFIPSQNKLMLGICFLFIGINIYDLGHRYRTYGNWNVKCNDIYSVEHCTEHDPIFSRNQMLRASYDPDRIKYANYLEFIPFWTGSVFSKIFEIRGHSFYANRLSNLQILKILLGFTFIFSLGGLWNNKQNRKYLVLLFIFLAYAFILSFFSSYRIYTTFSRPIALQGRYIFPVIAVFYLICTKGFSALFSAIPTKVKLPLFLLFGTFLIYQEFPVLAYNNGMVSISDPVQVRLRDHQNIRFDKNKNAISITKDARDRFTGIIFETPRRFRNEKINCIINLGEQQFYSDVRVDQNALFFVKFTKQIQSAMIGETQFEILLNEEIHDFRFLSTPKEKLYCYFVR